MRTILAFTTLLAAGILLIAGPALAQEPAREAVATDLAAAAKAACPAPLSLTLNASNPPNVFTGDFSAGQLTNQVGLNDPHPDKHFLYTFQWKPPHKCCQITKAVLTVRLKAILGGSAKDSSDAGNDGIDVMHNGAVVQPYAEAVYSSFPFSAGQTVTKTWNLMGAALANINANNRLSFYVQDDTMVQSATLQLTGCCLND